MATPDPRFPFDYKDLIRDNNPISRVLLSNTPLIEMAKLALAESIIPPPLLSRKRRLEDDRIPYQQPLANLLIPEDDCALRDLGIEPPEVRNSKPARIELKGCVIVTRGLSEDYR